MFLVGIFAGGYPTGVNNIPSSFGGQLIGMLTFFPLAFLPGLHRERGCSRRLNLLRVPPEVELEGLDMAEFSRTSIPSSSGLPEDISLPTGEEVEAAPILLEGYADVTEPAKSGTRAGS